jgi:hypothetical protein
LSDAAGLQDGTAILEVEDMPYTVAQLFTLSDEELDQLFSNSPAGDIPNGDGHGTAIIAPQRTFSPQIAEAINLFAWQGKTFDAQHGTLTNRLLAFGVNAIVAQVYKGPSWFDGKECIVLDYSTTSLVAEHIRDEIRQIGPGMYLGMVYWDKDKTIHFALQFSSY